MYLYPSTAVLEMVSYLNTTKHLICQLKSIPGERITSVFLMQNPMTILSSSFKQIVLMQRGCFNLCADWKFASSISPSLQLLLNFLQYKEKSKNWSNLQQSSYEISGKQKIISIFLFIGISTVQWLLFLAREKVLYHLFSVACLSKNALARLLKLTFTLSAAAYLLITSTTSGFRISSLVDILHK